MQKWMIDINCDVGEGLGIEESLFPYISSCNIACGGHAGDQSTMEKIVLLALKNGLKIGAHPSYPDRENFGRISVDISANDLKDSLKDQVDSLQKILQKKGGRLHHIKAHGALYNDLAVDPALADIFLESMAAYTPHVVLYVPYKSVIAGKAVTTGFEIMVEAFADRNYLEDYTLVSRKQSGAVIQEPEMVLKHLVGMVKEKKLITGNGIELPIEADTYCIHGDTPSALQILAYLGEKLPRQGIYLKK